MGCNHSIINTMAHKLDNVVSSLRLNSNEQID